MVEDSPVELLVNNAGFGAVGKFGEADFAKQLDMIAVHVIAPVRLYRAALPGMIDAGHGVIINVSSPAAFIPGPGNVTYSATKAYINVFSKCLAAELRGTGVKIQVLCPGFTITGFHDTPEYRQLAIRSHLPKALWMDADQVVSASLEALQRNQLFCIPGFKNRLMIGLARIGLGDGLSKMLIRLFPSLRSFLVHPGASWRARCLFVRSHFGISHLQESLSLPSDRTQSNCAELNK